MAWSFEGTILPAGEPGRVVVGAGQQANDPSTLPESFDGTINDPTFTYHPDDAVDLAIVSGHNVTWAAGNTRTPGFGTMSKLHIS